MTVVLMADPATGRVALYDEAPGGGDPADPNSLRNRPLNSPVSWLPNIYFHSDFNYMEVTAAGSTTISHSSFPAAGDPSYGGNAAYGGSASFNGNSGFAVGSYTADHLLLTHGLGYVPRYKVAVGNQMLPPGFPIQTNAGGAVRSVSSYATTSQIRLREFGNAGDATMTSLSQSYQVLVFANLPSPTGNRLIDWDPTTQVLTLAFGRWRSDRRYLQVVPGGSPFALFQGRNVDLANGAARTVTPNGSLVQNVSPLLRLYMLGRGSGTPMQYNGSFTSVPSIQVQAP